MIKDKREEVDATIQPDGMQKDYLVLPEEERANGDELFCDACGHLETDHPRGGRCGAAIATRCWCQRFTRAPERRGE